MRKRPEQTGSKFNGAERGAFLRRMYAKHGLLAGFILPRGDHPQYQTFHDRRESGEVGEVMNRLQKQYR